MRSTSSAFREAIYKQETDEAFLVLLEIDHDDLSYPIRVTSDGIATYSEGRSGSVVLDHSGEGNDGTLEGTAAFGWETDGDLGKCMGFDGVDQRCDCGTQAPLNTLGSGSFSLVFTMKHDTIKSGGNIFCKREDASNEIAVSSYLTENKINVTLKKVTGADYQFTDINPFDGDMHVIIVVVNRASDLLEAYDNGTKSATSHDISGLPGSLINTGLVSWGAQDEGSDPYDGKLTTCLLYNRILGDTDIARLTDGKGVEDGRIGYWDFKGDRYVPFPFDLTLPSDPEEGVSAGKLTIDAIDRTIIETIREIDSAPTVDIKVILASTPDILEAEFPDFYLANAQYDLMSVTGDLTVESFMNEPYPADSFVPSLFPGVF